MKAGKYTRRRFIKDSLGAGIIVAGAGLASCNASTTESFDAKGLPTVILGKTGIAVPRIGVGMGSRFCEQSEEDAISMATYALDNGFYYWDTAFSYQNSRNGVVSEEVLGKIVKERRKEIFLSTKVNSRNPEEAKKQVEESLKRLQTDHVDMLMIHDIQSMEDVEIISQSGQLIDLVQRYKEEGMARFIGFSGHASAEAKKAMAERGDFDCMLMAMNHFNEGAEKREEMVLPAANTNKMGVVLMKVVRPKETIQDVDAKELIRFALSLNGAHAIVLGMDSKEVVDNNVQILKPFKVMGAEEKNRMAELLDPYFNNERLEWMKKNYSDGYWA
jgi:uncharacterized protein